MPCEVMVFEKRPWWEPELQRQFRNAPGTSDADWVAVKGCRSSSDLLAALLGNEGCVGVLQFDDAPAECLRTLRALAAQRKTCATIVVASPQFAALEWTIRELGATAFLDHCCGGDRLARLCRRQWMLPAAERRA